MITKLKATHLVLAIVAILGSALNSRAPMQTDNPELQAALDKMREQEMGHIDDLLNVVDKLSKENGEDPLTGEERLQVQRFVAALFAATPHDDYRADVPILPPGVRAELMAPAEALTNHQGEEFGDVDTASKTIVQPMPGELPNSGGGTADGKPIITEGEVKESADVVKPAGEFA